MFDELLANEKRNFKILYEKVQNYLDPFCFIFKRTLEHFINKIGQVKSNCFCFIL